MKTTILFGTETGNAEMVAEDLGEALQGELDVVVRDMSGFTVDEFAADTFYLVLCSTYGDGELPGSAQPLFDALSGERPDLSGVRFAAFDFGSSGRWNWGGFNNGASLEDGLIGNGKGLLAQFASGNFVFDMVLEAAKENGSAKVLAEPTLTTRPTPQVSRLISSPTTKTSSNAPAPNGNLATGKASPN